MIRFGLRIARIQPTACLLPRSAPYTTTNEPPTSTERVERIIHQQVESTPEQAAADKVFDNSQYLRRLEPKSTYHPGSLNESSAIASTTKTRKDPFQLLNVDPLVEYKNTGLLANYLTDMGKIKPRSKTGLSAKSQRRLTQAIKRARSFGLLPVTSKFNPMHVYRSVGHGY